MTKIRNSHGRNWARNLGIYISDLPQEFPLQNRQNTEIQCRWCVGISSLHHRTPILMRHLVRFTCLNMMSSRLADKVAEISLRCIIPRLDLPYHTTGNLLVTSDALVVPSSTGL